MLASIIRFFVAGYKRPRVEILKENGEVEHGYAIKSSLGGWEVWEYCGILSCYGEDGKFPKSRWGWVRWAFKEGV
jgi:hypothetical protein